MPTPRSSRLGPKRAARRAEDELWQVADRTPDPGGCIFAQSLGVLRPARQRMAILHQRRPDRLTWTMGRLGQRIQLTVSDDRSRRLEQFQRRPESDAVAQCRISPGVQRQSGSGAAPFHASIIRFQNASHQHHPQPGPLESFLPRPDDLSGCDVRGPHFPRPTSQGSGLRAQGSGLGFMAGALFGSFAALFVASWRMRVRGVTWGDLGFRKPESLRRPWPPRAESSPWPSGRSSSLR